MYEPLLVRLKNMEMRFTKMETIMNNNDQNRKPSHGNEQNPARNATQGEKQDQTRVTPPGKMQTPHRENQGKASGHKQGAEQDATTHSKPKF